MTGKLSASQRRRLRADEDLLEPYRVSWPHPRRETIRRTFEHDPAKAQHVEAVLAKRGMLGHHPRPGDAL